MTRHASPAPPAGPGRRAAVRAPALAQAPAAPSKPAAGKAAASAVSDVLKVTAPQGGRVAAGCTSWTRRWATSSRTWRWCPGSTDQVLSHQRARLQGHRGHASCRSACTARSASTRRSPEAGCCPSWWCSGATAAISAWRAAARPQGLRVVRKRPGLPGRGAHRCRPARRRWRTRTRRAWPSTARPRWRAPSPDGTDLESYKVTTTVERARGADAERGEGEAGQGGDDLREGEGARGGLRHRSRARWWRWTSARR